MANSTERLARLEALLPEPCGWVLAARLQQGLKPASLINYLEDWLHFTRWLADRLGLPSPRALTWNHLAALRVPDLQAYDLSLADGAVNTRARRRTALKSLFEGLCTDPIQPLAQNPAVFARLPEKPAGSGQPMGALPVESVLASLEVAATAPAGRRGAYRPWQQARDQALLLLLAETGLGVGELLGLAREQVDLDRRLLLLGPDRLHRLSPRSGEALFHYWSELKAAGISAGPGSPLFFGPGGAPLTTRTVQRLVKRYAEPLGLGALTPRRLKQAAKQPVY